MRAFCGGLQTTIRLLSLWLPASVWPIGRMEFVMCAFLGKLGAYRRQPQRPTPPMTTPPPRNVGILIFEEVEVLDFAGPFEVFNVTAELNDPAPFNVYTIAATAAPVKTRGVLSINPNYSVHTAPKTDILIVPGGYGTRALLEREQLLAWLADQQPRLTYLCSVCTGALLLAKAGLLAGLTVTTHHGSLDHLRALTGGQALVVDDQRYTDNGQILTSGGISAGIDMALYLVHKLLGEAVLAKTLAEMEYDWTPSRALRWRAAAG